MVVQGRELEERGVEGGKVGARMFTVGCSASEEGEWASGEATSGKERERVGNEGKRDG